MEISRAAAEDAERIGELWAIIQKMHLDNVPWFFRLTDVEDLVEGAKRYIEKSDTYISAARIDGGIAGYIIGVVQEIPGSLIIKESKHMYLEQVFVDPSFRRKGIGRKLVDALCRQAEEIGLKRVILDAWEFNNEAREFFISIGFKVQIQRFALEAVNFRHD